MEQHSKGVTATHQISEQQLQQWAEQPVIAPIATRDVSVIIVHYNVADYLEHCLRSLQKALQSLEAEILVIDNASPDPGWQRLRAKFPEVRWIALSKNLGFGKANNIGFSLATGKYLLCLNPDSIVEEHTIQQLVEYMETHPDVGVAGCRVLNPDGTLQLACRRSFPTPFVALTRLVGLQKLFPRSRLFARYNLTYLDEHRDAEVDVLSGSCMLFRREALRDIGGFDPQFFLYGEDIDICYRIKQRGWKVMYVASATIVHFKGMSARRSPLDHTRLFYEAMEIFARKHFSRHQWFYRVLQWGIRVREWIDRLWRYRKPIGFLMADLLIVNGALIASTALRFGHPFGFPAYAYPTVFLILSAVMVTVLFFMGEYSPLERPSAYRSFAGVMIVFFFLASLTYFFKDYAFSRGVLLMTTGISALCISSVRLIYTLRQSVTGTQRRRRIAIVGTGDPAQQLARRLVEQEGQQAVVVGFIGEHSTPPANHLPLLGTLSQLETILQRYQITELVITVAMPYSQMIHLMRILARQEVNFYFAHDYDEVTVDRILEEVTGRRADVWRIFLPRYRVLKRLMDICLAAMLLTIGQPVVNLLFGKGRQVRQKLFAVFKGTLSLVGAYRAHSQQVVPFKEGIISLAHLQRQEILTERAIQALNAFYGREYSIALDMEIMVHFALSRLLWKKETKT